MVAKENPQTNSPDNSSADQANAEELASLSIQENPGADHVRHVLGAWLDSLTDEEFIGLIMDLKQAKAQ